MSLLDRLKAVGEYDSTGQFTLDEEQARRKLARFQLTDSRRFVLELVMAAVSLGARRLAVSTNPDLVLSWEGPSFASEALQDLERFLLEAPCPERHLAVALNALEGLKPKRLTVAPQRVEVGGLGNGPELADLLVRECGLGPAEVSLNGTVVSERPHWLGPSLKASGPGLEVEVGLHPTLASSELILVYHGVAVARPAPELELPLRAVVHGEDFTLNASHSDVVHDEALARAVALVEETGRDCLRRVIADFRPDGPPQLATFLRAHPQKRGTAWWGLPLFPLIDGRLASAQQLEEQCATLGVVPVCRSAPAGTPHEFLLVRTNADVEAVLKRIFGERVGPGETHVLARLQADANRKAWERRPRKPVLTLGRWLARTPVEGPHFQGELGLEAQDGPREAVLTVLYQGRLLSTESLEVPLPYVAALDFSELDVRSDWGGPAPGRLYSQALDKLHQEAERLYLQLSEKDVDGALPGVREGLLVLLSAKGNRLKHFRQARLFTLATGGTVSLAALEDAAGRGEPIFVLPRGQLLPSLPAEAVPRGVILTGHAQGEVILQRTLGKRLKPFNPRQLQQLQELSERLKQKKAARLSRRADVSLQGLAGELALLPELGPGKLEVLRQGVALGGPRSFPSRLCAFEAIADSPRLTPQPDYRGPVADAAWEEVQAAVQEAEGRALDALADTPPADPAWNGVLLKLLAERPTSHLAGRALFPAWPQPVSLSHVRAEQAARGRVLVAEAWELRELDLGLSESFVLQEGSRTLLERLVPGLVWESCGARLRHQQAEREFLARPAVPAVRVSGSARHREGVSPPLTGEVVLVPSGSGEVRLYFRNRQVGEAEWLPAGLQGAVQSSDFAPSPDFSGVESDGAWKAARDAIEAAASRLIGKAAQQALDLPVLTWVALLSWEGLAQTQRERLRALKFLPRAGGGKLSLAELGSQAFYLNALSGAPPKVPVLLLKVEEVGPVGKLVKLSSYAGQHHQEGLLRARHRRMRKLPTTLRPSYVEADFEEVALRGKLGLPRKLAREVVLLQGGGPVGWYESPMPLVGTLEGRWDLSGPEPIELGKEQRRRLTGAARTLYEELARQYDPAQHRELMLEYLRTEWRTAQGSLVARLPLFRCWQGTASLEALQEEAGERGELVCLERGAEPPVADSRLYPLVESEQLPAIFGAKLHIVRRPRLGEGLGMALRAAGAGASGTLWNVARAVVTPGWQRLEWVAGGAANLLERVAGMVAGKPEAATPAPATEPSPKDSPERRLLASLRRHFALSVQNPARRHSRAIVENIRWARYIMGPPCWWDKDGQLCLNLNHSSLRYCLAHQDDDPAVVQMLLVHLFCLINQRLTEVTDEHEEVFLRALGTTLAQAFGS